VCSSDSLGATARFGQGDAQWLTAGRGIVHCEMFPLVDTERPNPLELFQIWLNLPAADKMVEPHFSMLWADQIPTVEQRDEHGRRTWVTLVAGALNDVAAPPPPPHSWAAKPEADVCIWTIRLEPNACWTLPAARSGSNRVLSYFEGKGLELESTAVAPASSVHVRADASLQVTNGPAQSELLLLQGRPLNEPIASYGPFVMNSMAQIQQAFVDYQRTGFGGWPWKQDDPVHPRETSRFAKHVDGRVYAPDERKTKG
jgi:redox-sensitive bicupin YhaK (pirin superfamily)